jgi:hypothetical protein
VRSAHRRLLRRARALGWRLTHHAGLAISADLPGIGTRRRDGAIELRLPADACELRLRSRSFVPAELDIGVPDGRRLGVALALALNGAPVPASAFRAGWHPPEGGGAWRWTDGDATLHLPSRTQPATLLIRVMPAGGRYWREPARRSQVTATAAVRVA